MNSSYSVAILLLWSAAIDNRDDNNNNKNALYNNCSLLTADRNGLFAVVFTFVGLLNLYKPVWYTTAICMYKGKPYSSSALSYRTRTYIRKIEMNLTRTKFYVVRCCCAFFLYSFSLICTLCVLREACCEYENRWIASTCFIENGFSAGCCFSLSSVDAVVVAYIVLFSFAKQCFIFTAYTTTQTLEPIQRQQCVLVSILVVFVLVNGRQEFCIETTIRVYQYMRTTFNITERRLSMYLFAFVHLGGWWFNLVFNEIFTLFSVTLIRQKRQIYYGVTKTSESLM